MSYLVSLPGFHLCECLSCFLHGVFQYPYSEFTGSIHAFIYLYIFIMC